jgi:predicted nucleotidyltransferase
MKPLKIILFGSYARADARPDSDIDLLIIAESSEPRYRRAAPLYGVLSDIAVPMDILVYSPQEVQEWSGVEQAFVTTSIREERYCMKTQADLVKGWLRKVESRINREEFS